jgi:hypothetical protein
LSDVLFLRAEKDAKLFSLKILLESTGKNSPELNPSLLLFYLNNSFFGYDAHSYLKC